MTGSPTSPASSDDLGSVRAAPRTVSLRLPEADYAALRMVAAARGRSMSRFVEELLRSELRRQLDEVATAVDSARRLLGSTEIE